MSEYFAIAHTHHAFGRQAAQKLTRSFRQNNEIKYIVYSNKLICIMNYISKSCRDQIQFLSIDQMVSEDSWARIVDLFVDCIPFNKIRFKHSNLNKEGRPPFAPSDMLKLFLYCYKYGIRSSYKIHHHCLVNVEVISFSA